MSKLTEQQLDTLKRFGRLDKMDFDNTSKSIPKDIDFIWNSGPSFLILSDLVDPTTAEGMPKKNFGMFPKQLIKLTTFFDAKIIAKSNSLGYYLRKGVIKCIVNPSVELNAEDIMQPPPISDEYGITGEKGIPMEQVREDHGLDVNPFTEKYLDEEIKEYDEGKSHEDKVREKKAKIISKRTKKTKAASKKRKSQKTIAPKMELDE